MTALLEVERLSVYFRGVVALDEVTASVSAGGTTALIGPNGAGKTTLFNCVTGISQGTGRIAFGGRDISTMPPHRRSLLGMTRTFQTPALVDYLSVTDNVLIGAQSAGHRGIWSAVARPPAARRSLRAAHERALELLDALGLTRHRGAEVGALPHGIRRRVEIARALMASPSLLLLDEPAAGMDVSEALEMCRWLTGYAAEHDITLLLVEHSVGLVMRLAHTVLVLDAGRLIASGTPEEVREDPQVVAAYLGNDR
ncbi:ABC transporter ATP-binding protein [Actinomadura opuntiae]|uniref:ABC transporter ATP-binding protein n=1 Tax=Actinomadura sp. OS1-43 TaxID=604315 RepID=UPI00255AAB6C|nr:ABC transporter ATP-binding protein [Actinomadura sp. OS1-43]MDL4812674.1 ABC transporter ATP-binding protein [Actinomadura sp. OS1-43]